MRLSYKFVSFSCSIVVALSDFFTPVFLHFLLVSFLLYFIRCPLLLLPQLILLYFEGIWFKICQTIIFNKLLRLGGPSETELRGTGTLV